MAAGHRVAAHSVLDRPEHGGTLPLEGDNTATNIMVGYSRWFDKDFFLPVRRPAFVVNVDSIVQKIWSLCHILRLPIVAIMWAGCAGPGVGRWAAFRVVGCAPLCPPYAC